MEIIRKGLFVITTIICLHLTVGAQTSVFDSFLAPGLNLQEREEELDKIQYSNLNTREKGQFHYSKGWVQSEKGLRAESIVSYLEAIHIFEGLWFKTQKDIQWIVDCNIQIADVWSDHFNWEKDFEYLDNSLQALKELNAENVGSRYFKLMYNYGYGYAELDQKDKSFQFFLKAYSSANSFKDSLKVEMRQGLNYQEIGDLEQSIEIFNNAIAKIKSRGPDNSAFRKQMAQLHVNLGRSLDLAGREDEAKRIFDVADNQHKSAHKFKLYEYLGAFYEEAKQIDSSNFYLSKAITLKSTHVLDKKVILLKLIKRGHLLEENTDALASLILKDDQIQLKEQNRLLEFAESNWFRQKQRTRVINFSSWLISILVIVGLVLYVRKERLKKNVRSQIGGALEEED